LIRALRVLAYLSLCLIPLTGSAAAIDDARRLAAEGDDAAALEQVEQALGEAPGDASARLLKGVLLSRLGRSEEAVAHFRTLITTDRPELPEPYNNLAVLLAARGDYENARVALMQAVTLQPDYHVAHENLGDIYTQLASQAYRQAAASSDDARRLQHKATAAERVLDDIRLPATTPSAAVAVAVAATTDAACLSIDGLASGDRAREVERWLQERGVTGAFERLGVTGTQPTYRVYVPPAENLAAARSAASALRQAGIEDLMVIASGDLANGISLGVFSRRSNAEQHAQRLSARGVQTRITATGPEAAARYRVVTLAGGEPPTAEAITSAFPESQVSATACR
jgi:tetratricopeptide (TPR) repeat protein